MQCDSVITMYPKDNEVPPNLTKFRWNMQVPLPYPFPSRNCICRDARITGVLFEFSIHNHFNRVVQNIRDPASGMNCSRAFWENQQHPPEANPPGCFSVFRQPVRSVVFFDGTTDYSSPTEA